MNVGLHKEKYERTNARLTGDKSEAFGFLCSRLLCALVGVSDVYSFFDPVSNILTNVVVYPLTRSL